MRLARLDRRSPSQRRSFSTQRLRLSVSDRLASTSFGSPSQRLRLLTRLGHRKGCREDSRLGKYCYQASRDSI